MTGVARKHNVTGIKKLSLGTTKNNRGYELRRYCVNHESECKSFYFGEKQTQKSAFLKAVLYMIDRGICDVSVDEALVLYAEKQHENLI